MRMQCPTIKPAFPFQRLVQEANLPGWSFKFYRILGTWYRLRHHFLHVRHSNWFSFCHGENGRHVGAVVVEWSNNGGSYYSSHDHPVWWAKQPLVFITAVFKVPDRGPLGWAVVITYSKELAACLSVSFYLPFSRMPALFTRLTVQSFHNTFMQVSSSQLFVFVVKRGMQFDWPSEAFIRTCYQVNYQTLICKPLGMSARLRM